MVNLCQALRRESHGGSVPIPYLLCMSDDGFHVFYYSTCNMVPVYEPQKRVPYRLTFFCFYENYQFNLKNVKNKPAFQMAFTCLVLTYYLL